MELKELTTAFAAMVRPASAPPPAAPPTRAVAGAVPAGSATGTT